MRVVLTVCFLLFSVGCAGRVEAPAPEGYPIADYSERAAVSIAGNSDPSNGTRVQARAWCNHGDELVSGGCTPDAGIQVAASAHVPASMPQGEPDSWSCIFANGTSQTAGGAAWAICRAIP